MTVEQWRPGDIVLDAGGGLWTRAGDHDVTAGWPWAHTHGYAPGGAKQLPTQEGAVEESYPPRPLTLILRDGQPVHQVELMDLAPDRAWPIPLPREDDSLLDRTLEARGSDGTLRARWRYAATQMMAGWECVEGPEPGPTVPCIGVRGSFVDLFEEIVAGCIKYGWTLWSMPPIKGDNSEQQTQQQPDPQPAPAAGRHVKLRKRTKYTSG